MNLEYSFIIPVYNRPEEVRELLESFVALTYNKPYEIVIVEDGSTQLSEDIVYEFTDRLTISYYFKPNSGPGISRNYGMQRANGNYFILLDSDCILPPKYLNVIDNYLNKKYLDCFGGADAAHPDFTDLQKGINYVMTSIFTTGGIRGKKMAIHKFEPRSFNMGISKKAFELTGGFGSIHPGEDPDLSQRIFKAGLKTGFIPDAFVYHKRRISWSKFYTQVTKFGLVRPILNQWHPQSSKITFWFPSLFVLYFIFSLLMAAFGIFHFAGLIFLYCAVIFIDSAIANQSLKIGLLSVVAMFIQFFGYGLAFLKSTFFIGLCKKDPKIKFPHLFFD